MIRILFCLIFFIPASLFAQVELGLFGGISTYTGDLAEDEFIAFSNAKSAYGIYGRYTPIPFLSFKLNLYKGQVEGSDAQAVDVRQRRRNLSFQSNILDLGLTAEINLFTFKLNNGSHLTPYFYGGITGFYFNPKADYLGSLVELQPLGTEGQGMPGNDERYSNFSYAIPFGGGLKYKVSDYMTIGVDIGARKTYTDYLDDVSTNYPDLQELAENNGILAAQLSDRTQEFTGIPSQIQEGAKRGNPDSLDWYFMGGVTLAYVFKRRTVFADYK